MRKRELDRVQYLTNWLRIKDDLQPEKIDDWTDLTGVFSIKNNLKPLGPTAEFYMQNNYYRVRR